MHYILVISIHTFEILSNRGLPRRHCADGGADEVATKATSKGSESDDIATEKAQKGITNRNYQ